MGGFSGLSNVRWRSDHKLSGTNIESDTLSVLCCSLVPSSNFSSVLSLIGWDIRPFLTRFRCVMQALVRGPRTAPPLAVVWFEGSSREERGVSREEESVKSVSSNLTRPHAISLFRRLFVNVNYLAFLQSRHRKVKKRGFDANRCSAALLFFVHDSLKGPKHFFSPNCSHSNEQFQGKPGQCTMTASKELKKTRCPPSPVWSGRILRFYKFRYIWNLFLGLQSVTVQ